MVGELTGLHEDLHDDGGESESVGRASSMKRGGAEDSRVEEWEGKSGGGEIYVGEGAKTLSQRPINGKRLEP